MAKNKKITFLEAKQKFINQGRNDIELCEDGYFGWSKKSKFYDKKNNSYFYALPVKVYFQKSSDPKFKFEKLRKAIKEKYGVENISQLDSIKIKKEETTKKNYGVLNPFQSEEIKKRIKLKHLEVLGVSYPTQSELVKEKIKKVLIKKYGVNNPAKHEIFKKKIKETNIEKYGKKTFLLTEEFKNKYSISKKILETNEWFSDWYNKQPEPKPSNITLNQHFKEKYISLEKLKEYFENYRQKKTYLEGIAENLFETKHFNKKPEQIKKCYRPDFKLYDNVYLNVDGLYWHSEKEKNKNYHFDMRKEFEENGLRLFQFYENEIKEKSNIIKSIVNNTLNKTQNKIYARKCDIKLLTQSESENFLNENHLMGSVKTKHIGLINENKLVCLLSYKIIKNICKIERFCSIIDTNVIGGFNKLLNYVEKNLINKNITEIHNWIDLRYGTGIHLEKKQFVKIKETLGWKWTDGGNTYNRLRCRANMDNRKLSEKQHAEELGWFKIYDAGQRLYVKKINNF